MADDLAEVPEQIVFFSSSTTGPARRRARLNAMLVPMTPPPMTTTSADSIPASRSIVVRKSGRSRPGSPPRDDRGLADRNQAGLDPASARASILLLAVWCPFRVARRQ